MFLKVETKSQCQRVLETTINISNGWMNEWMTTAWSSVTLIFDSLININVGSRPWKFYFSDLKNAKLFFIGASIHSFK